MDRGAWQAIVLGVAKSWTQLSMHEYIVSFTKFCKLLLKHRKRIQSKLGKFEDLVSHEVLGKIASKLKPNE